MFFPTGEVAWVGSLMCNDSQTTSTPEAPFCSLAAAFNATADSLGSLPPPYNLTFFILGIMPPDRSLVCCA